MLVKFIDEKFCYDQYSFETEVKELGDGPTDPRVAVEARYSIICVGLVTKI